MSKSKWDFDKLPIEKKQRIYEIHEEAEKDDWNISELEEKELLIMHNKFKISPYTYCGCPEDVGFKLFFKKFYLERKRETEILTIFLQIIK